MYFKNVTLKNVGPIEDINYSFSFNDDGHPKPLILVGTNGSGKSILLSYLLNPLMAAQQVAFDDAEVESGKVYKLRSPQYIKSGSTFSYSRVNFGSDFSCYEWQLTHQREEYLKQFRNPEIDSSFDEIPSNEGSLFNGNFLNNQVEVSKQFQSNCVLYFPANRFELPAWLNESSLNATAYFINGERIDRVSNRKIIQQSPLFESKNWLLDIVFDMTNYDIKLSPKYFIDNNTQQFSSIQEFLGYEGNSSNIWNETIRLVKLILGTDENVRFGIGPRQNRNISIVRNGEQFISNIFQLSTGQTSVLNIVLSILRDFDLSRAPFEKLEDVSGVVIIDEIDAHFHADLQCNLLPTVISTFPKVQFILTTHSPLFLLGMRNKFGDTGFDILSLPTGEKIGIEEFEEFQSAFNFYKDSSTFRQKIESEVNQTQKPVIFVEGTYDVKYLEKAASFLGKQSILDQIVLCNGEGFGNLDNIWKTCESSRLSIAFPRIVGLIYDCDMSKKISANRNMAKKRVIPAILNNPISKGIENLFPTSKINELRE
jgi:AAA domain, putative AbiEii toxin, Type IV TA system